MENMSQENCQSQEEAMQDHDALPFSKRRRSQEKSISTRNPKKKRLHDTSSATITTQAATGTNNVKTERKTESTTDNPAVNTGDASKKQQAVSDDNMGDHKMDCDMELNTDGPKTVGVEDESGDKSVDNSPQFITAKVAEDVEETATIKVKGVTQSTTDYPLHDFHGETSKGRQFVLGEGTSGDEALKKVSELIMAQVRDKDSGTDAFNVVTLEVGTARQVNSDGAVSIVFPNGIPASWERALRGIEATEISDLTTDGRSTVSTATGHNSLTGSDQQSQSESCKDTAAPSTPPSAQARPTSKASPSKCETCGAMVRVCHFKRHQQMHLKMSDGNRKESDGSITCNICHRVFSRKYHLRRHMDTVHANYPCNSCNMFFDREDEMAAHWQEAHCVTTAEHHTCMACGTSFKEKFDLIKHSSDHSKDGSLCCPFCQDIFVDQDQLLSHLDSHTSEFPYACRRCSESFRTSNELYKHQRVHGGNAPFHCPFCDKSYVEKRDVVVHEKLHLGGQFRCEVCGKVFLRMSHKRSHEKMHNGVHHIFTCVSCGRGFSRKFCYQNHLKTHITGSDAVSCGVCQHMFANKNSLTVHIKKVHPEVAQSLPDTAVVAQQESAVADESVPLKTTVTGAQGTEQSGLQERVSLSTVTALPV